MNSYLVWRWMKEDDDEVWWLPLFSLAFDEELKIQNYFLPLYFCFSSSSVLSCFCFAFFSCLSSPVCSSSFVLSLPVVSQLSIPWSRDKVEDDGTLVPLSPSLSFLCFLLFTCISVLLVLPVRPFSFIPVLWFPVFFVLFFFIIFYLCFLFVLSSLCIFSMYAPSSVLCYSLSSLCIC